jgi:hypothetical protein
MDSFGIVPLLQSVSDMFYMTCSQLDLKFDLKYCYNTKGCWLRGVSRFLSSLTLSFKIDVSVFVNTYVSFDMTFISKRDEFYKNCYTE